MHQEYNHELPPIAMPENGQQQPAEAMPAAAPETRTAPSPSVPPPPAPSVTPLNAPPAMAPPVAPQPVAQATPANGSPAMADDGDLIEKEWVERAKQIVEQTRTEPYIQKQEVSKLKADYLQKRYNKTIKVDES